MGLRLNGAPFPYKRFKQNLPSYAISPLKRSKKAAISQRVTWNNGLKKSPRYP